MKVLSAILALAFSLLWAAAACGQATQPVLRGQGALGDWTHDAPGVRHLITIADLPAPFETRSVDNGPHMIPRPAGALPKVPPGFEVSMLTEGLENPRKIVTAPNGDLFIAESAAGRIRFLRLDEQGRVVKSGFFATGLQQPFGIAFYPPGPEAKYVYLANTGSVVRFPFGKSDGAPEMIVPDLSAGGRLRGGGHWTRDIVFSPDGSRMFVSIGSRSNNSDDAGEKNRACILSYRPDGSDMRMHASGLRNAVGLAIHPTTGQLWASVNERDGLGDDLVPDYITQVEPDGFYGWPWFYLGNHYDPAHRGKHPELAGKVLVPDVLLQTHSASLCMAFYTGSQFPAEYRNDAFAAEHGSWNRSRRTGYKVIRVPMKDGKATGEYEDFLTGFVMPNGDVWGRPVGVTVAADGALIVTDDGGNRVWRIAYRGK
jgi:glucose/arabinose dehydrogenase